MRGAGGEHYPLQNHRFLDNETAVPPRAVPFACRGRAPVPALFPIDEVG
jgi:hypothetical protein